MLTQQESSISSEMLSCFGTPIISYPSSGNGCFITVFIVISVSYSGNLGSFLTDAKIKGAGSVACMTNLESNFSSSVI